jgi:hypothetical protein
VTRPNHAEAHGIIGDVDGRDCVVVNDMVDTAPILLSAKYNRYNNLHCGHQPDCWPRGPIMIGTYKKSDETQLRPR